MKFTESTVEEATLEWFQQLGYDYRPGPEIAHDGLFAERKGYEDVVLRARLRSAIERINPGLPPAAIEDAIKQITRAAFPTLILNNRAFHRMLTDGVDVRYRRKDGGVVTEKAWLFNFSDIDANDWLVVNQFTVVENNVQRRPDVLVFINGLPLAVIELKNAADEDATIGHAYNQLQTYKAQTPSLFTYNSALIISDGIEARVGTITANQERFNLWRTVDGKNLAPVTQALGEVLIKGLFHKERFLEWARHFVTFEDDGSQVAKKAAAYHQFHAVKTAVTQTLRASKAGGGFG